MAEETLAESIPAGAGVAFDADALIYFVERHERFYPVLAPFVERVAARVVRGHASHLTLLEVLVGPIRDGKDNLAATYRKLLGNTSDFSLHPLDEAAALRAASIRARDGLRTPDAVVGATALLADCSYLVTNDPVFRRITGLTVRVVEDYVLAEQEKGTT